MFRWLISLPILAVATTAHAAPDITGDWIVQDRSGVVTIERCGSGLCGRISKALIIKPNYPRTDIHNPDPALRGRRLIGIQVISGFAAKADRWSDGKIYDPERGKTYKAQLRLNPDGSLRVTGCYLVVCQSRRWTRR